jgi:hypothetical protein
VRILLFVVAALAAVGCTPVIGDSCAGSLDCSINNERVCDTTVRNGQCTVFNCEPDSCPDAALCVRFREGASQFTACMRSCEASSQCREGDGFRCALPDPMLEDRFYLDEDGDGAPGPEETRVSATVVDVDPLRAGFCTGTLAQDFES